MISSMIHKIFTNGFEDDIVKLKSKIRMKMLSMDYMRSDFNFIENFNKFWSGYAVFNVLNIDKKDIIDVIYSNPENPNPIAYLTLIIFLFESLNSYYEYNIDEQDIKVISQKPSLIISLTQPLKPNGFLYYNELIQKLYGNHYSLKEKVEKKKYNVKCNFCGHEWIIPQYYICSKLVHCPCCEKK
jgi:hypothetical protein